MGLREPPIVGCLERLLLYFPLASDYGILSAIFWTFICSIWTCDVYTLKNKDDNNQCLDAYIKRKH